MTNPRGPTPPTYDPSLAEPGYGARRSLVEELGEVVDDIRQIASDSDIGLRPYTVHAIKIKWSGGEIGRGSPEVASDHPFLPIPKIENISTIQKSLTQGGASERGDIRITGISPRYTESEIEEYLSTADADESFIEIRIDERDGETVRRRFVLASPPTRRPDKFDWMLHLKRQAQDRQTDGTRRTVNKVWL